MSNGQHFCKPSHLENLSLLLTLSLVAPSLLAAGTVPGYTISDAVKESNPPKNPAKQETPLVPVIVQGEEKPIPLSDGQKILVRDFQVEGDESISLVELSPLLDSYRNRELTMGEINEAANKVTVLFRNKGYLVARAYVPKQNMQNGVLLIKVIVGKYGQFKMNNSSLIKDSMLQGVFDHVRKASPVITQTALERPILLVGDMPGAVMPMVSIASGKEPGTSDFTVETHASNRVSGFAFADNYGSRFTGKNRLSAGLEVNSPFRIGDKLSLNGMSTEGAGLLNGRTAYAFPLSYNGLRGEIAVSRTTYKLGDEYVALNATGVANSVEATLSYPIKLTRQVSETASLNIANKKLQDDIAATSTSTPKRAKVATLSLQKESWGSLLGLASYLNLNAGLSLGYLDFDNAVQKLQNQAGANTAGNYSKVNVSLMGNIALNSKWSLTTSLQAQQSLGKNLDGSEQLSISGSGGIKSYPDGVSSDNGYLFGEEWNYSISPIENIAHKVGFFVNFGEVAPENGSYTTVGRIAISDAGFSYSVSKKGLFGRLQIAKTLGVQQATITYNNEWKVLTQLGVSF